MPWFSGLRPVGVHQAGLDQLVHVGGQRERDDVGLQAALDGAGLLARGAVGLVERHALSFRAAGERGEDLGVGLAGSGVGDERELGGAFAALRARTALAAAGRQQRRPVAARRGPRRRCGSECVCCQLGLWSSCAGSLANRWTMSSWGILGGGAAADLATPQAPAGGDPARAARGRGLGVRAQVRRLPGDRVRGRRRAVPAVARGQAAAALLPRAGLPCRPLRAGRGDRGRRRGRGRGLRRAAAAHPPRRLADRAAGARDAGGVRGLRPVGPRRRVLPGAWPSRSAAKRWRRWSAASCACRP